MVLSKIPMPGRPMIWVIVGQGPIALAVGAGGGCLHIFTLLYPFSLLSPSLGDGPIETEILSQRVAKPKTTNKPTNNYYYGYYGYYCCLLQNCSVLFCFILSLIFKDRRDTTDDFATILCHIVLLFSTALL